MGKTTSASSRNRKMSLRLTEDEYDKLNHYAEKWDMTKTDIILESFEHYIRWINSDYDLPTAEIQRLNQLIDANSKLTTVVMNLEKMVVSSNESLVGFVRGENYLSDIDQGDF